MSLLPGEKVRNIKSNSIGTFVKYADSLASTNEEKKCSGCIVKRGTPLDVHSVVECWQVADTQSLTQPVLPKNTKVSAASFSLGLGAGCLLLIASLVV